jgi:hypothetical protein
MTDRCAECGFDASSVTVQDAVTTLRSLPRRWRELADRVEDDDAERDRLLGRAEEAKAFEAIAAEAEGVDADGWKAPGRLDALLEHVHRGVHDLRAAEAA